MYFIFLLVGGIFTFIGALFLKKYLFYKKHGSMIRGTVIGVEEYVSTNTNKQSSTYYAPIIEFSFNGATYLFKDGGSSNGLGKYRIGQSVKLLSHAKGPEYIYLIGGVGNIFLIVFIILGLILIAVGIVNLIDEVTSPKGFQFDWFGFIPLIIFFFVGGGIIKKIREFQKKTGEKVEFDFNKETLIKRKDLKGKNVYYTQGEIKAKLSKFNQSALLISGVYFIGMSTLLYYYWNDQSDAFKNSVLDILKDIDRWWEFINYLSPRVNNDFFGLLIILFFFLTSVHSLTYSLRKSMNN